MATDGSKYAAVPPGVSLAPPPFASLHVAPPSVLSETMTLYAPLFAAVRPRVSFQAAARCCALLGSAEICGLKELPSVHSEERPLISIGVVQCADDWTHLESMIGASQKPPRLNDRLHRGSARKSVQVT